MTPKTVRKESSFVISNDTALELYNSLIDLVCAVCPPERKPGKVTLNVDGVESYFKEPIERALKVLNRVKAEKESHV